MTITKQAKSVLPFVVGAILDIAGKVQKVVKRDGQCKLIIEPGDVPGFVVFADFTSDAENLINPKIRKGSLVRVKGKLQTFGAAAVCLSDCQIVEKCSDSRVYARTENPKKT